MNKSTQSVITIMALVLLASITFLFIIAQTTEAGPTKYKVDWWYYKCSVKDTGVVCIDWKIITVVKPKESLWHKVFGDHPHGDFFVYNANDNVHQRVLSCSECDPKINQ